MFLTGKIKTPNSTGSPDYIICNQGVSALSLTNLNFKLSLGKNSIVKTLVDTTDLSTISGLSYPTYTFGNYDIKFTSFAIDTTTSTFQANIEVFYTGTSDVVTWERFYLTIEISKAGYLPFTNTFEFYNYDVGNASSISGITDTTGNEDFEIVLIDKTNNLDIYNRQTLPFSSFITLRRPFTNQLYFYNMVGTEGTIKYYDVDNVEIGSGNSGKVYQTEDFYISQIISLFNEEECTTGKMTLKSVWFPEFAPSTSYNNECQECTNNIIDTVASFYLDATNTSVYQIGGASYFLSEFMTQTVLINLIDCNSEILDSDTHTIDLTYALWTADSSAFLTPIEWTFTPAVLGENVVNFNNTYTYEDIKLQECIINHNLKTCNWWTVEATEVCNEYTFKNCSSDPLTLTLQLLNDSKVFEDILEVEVDGLENETLTFDVDGVYMLKIVQGVTTKYFSLPIFCAIQDCYLKYLKQTLCETIDTNCISDSHYDFNAFIINSHSLFLLLNDELNNNYIYTTVSSDKLDELYTIKTFIDRIKGYCETSTSPCTSCD